MVFKFRRRMFTPYMLAIISVTLLVRIIGIFLKTSEVSLSLFIMLLLAICFTILMVARTRAYIKDQMPTELDRYVDPYKAYKVAQPGDPDFVKTFDYYCPHCLFQTNEDWGRCPECNKGVLRETDEPTIMESKLSHAISPPRE